jgi:dTDP-4-amino-4,6-dideoxygalactose transaminase
VESLAAPALPHTERLVTEILTLPMSSGHTDEEIDRVAAVVRAYFSA